jgi:DNA-binding FrmR family transcriptional regulator
MNEVEDRIELVDEDESRKSTSYAADKERILNRIKRMEGQVRGIHRMVENDQYCIDVLTQISAVMSAARQVGMLVLEDHIRGCVIGGEGHKHNGGDPEETLKELTQAIERFTRTAG